MNSKQTAVALALLVGCTVVHAGSTSPVVDGHNHDAISAADKVIDVSKLERMTSRGLDAVIVPLPIDRSDALDLSTRIEDELRQLRQLAANDPSFSIANDPNAVLAGTSANGIQILFSVEWFGSIFENDPALVKRYRGFGVRIISLTDGDPDGLFGEGERSATLTPFGFRIVSAMNRAGVLIDITHLDHSQKLEVIRRSTSPVVATHALSGEVNPTSFNLPPEVVTALAEHGGSVWVSFNRSDLLGGRAEENAIDLLVDHIEVLIERLGADHVGIGSDLQAGGRYVPDPLNRTDTFSVIGRRLIQRGHPPRVVDGVLGVNILRVLAEDLGGSPAAQTRSEIEWIKVPAGAFTMGSDEEEKADQAPEHRVILDEFEISRHEITVKQFRDFVDSTGYVTEVERDGSGYGFNGTTWVADPRLSWWAPGFSQADDHPVVLVTKKDARAFCEWLSETTGDTIDLPTEAQWEKAARGDDLRPHPWGTDPIDGTRCNFADAQLGQPDYSTLDLDDGFEFTSPVGSFPEGSSPYGVDDLCGNVWEWIRDLYSEDYYSRSPLQNPTGPTDGHYDITRGGAWGIGGQFEKRLKSTWRNFNNPGRGFDVIGFRVVRESGSRSGARPNDY